MKKHKNLILTLIFPLLLFILSPLDLNINQRILLSILSVVIIWWATGVVSRKYSSLALLVTFIIFSKTPVNQVFMFPLSPNFILIAASFLLSQGIVNSNLAERISSYILHKYGKTPNQLIVLSFIFGILLIFVIPQPFPRVILLSSIYVQFIRAQKVRKKKAQILLFSVYVASTCTSMAFLNGDIILNYSALQFSRVSLGWLEWAKYMTVPSLIVCSLIAIMYILIFRGEIRKIEFNIDHTNDNKKKLDKKEITAAIIMVTIVLLWMTEAIHQINPSLIAVVGVLSMTITGLIKFSDIKKINYELFIFLTAAFSIGRVMEYSGIAQKILSRLIVILPEGSGWIGFISIIIITMLIHIFLGSAISTLSIALPVIITLFSGEVPVKVLTFITFITVSIHYPLPFHHATIMIGAGEGHYTSRHTIKIGLAFTIMVFAFIFFIYIPWWSLVGLL